MENQRTILFVALALVCFALWTAWQKDYPNKLSLPTNQVTEATAPNPQIPSQSPKTTASVSSSTTVGHEFITVKTDVLDVKIDTLGGNIVSANLPKYPNSIEQPNVPTTLLNDDSNNFYIAESALVSDSGPDSQTAKAKYTSTANSYELQPGENTLQVVLTWKNPAGLVVNKILTFKRNDYLIQVAYEIDNQSKDTWTGNFYTQLSRTQPVSLNKGWFQIHPYMGAAISSPENRYQELNFNKMASEPLDTNIRNGWAAMVQHYFLSAWIPNSQQNYRYYTNVSNNIYTIGMVSPTVSVPPSKQANISAKLYTGPEISERLSQIAPGLNLTVSYGWLWPISEAIFWVMKHIYNIVGNWGWAIIIVTIIIKLLFYHLSSKSYRSMANMRKLQPKIEAIKERYGEDKQKMSQAMMELYKTEKVNPLGGCLPMIIQIPVFFALYMVLVESIEFRQAPWFGWIHDLSAPDPFYILPILMGLTMFIQQRLNPPPPDPTQAKVMMFLPLLFTIIFLNFPAGLVLYWAVNNGLSILQQWYVMRSVELGNAKKKQQKKAHA